jgi:ankyrin repeat protein
MIDDKRSPTSHTGAASAHMTRALSVLRFAFGVAAAVWALCAFAPGALAASPAAGGTASLADAVKRQDKAGTRALLKQRADVNATDAEGMTALHWAAHWGDLDTVRLLLGAGARPRIANRYGVTPLHEACTLGNVAMVETLLDAGADPNAAYGEGETPLMTAALSGSAPAVRLLALRGANVNATEGFRGQTALMWAAAEDHEDVARLLIELGADVNVRSRHYEFPQLVGGNGGIIHDRPEGGLTALMFAARQGSIATADRLLAAGADINASEPQYGFTALQTAIFNGHYALAVRLAGKGADVNDGSLYTAIETRNLAAYSNRPNPPDVDEGVGSLDLITALLTHGADPNRPYVKRIPPRQAQGDITVPAGATPLARATRATDLPVVRALLDHGANPNVGAKDGTTPLMIAAGFGARRGGDEDISEKPGRADPVEAMRLFVKAGANVNAANETGNTALHYAALTGSARAVEFLASSGAALDAKNKQDKTPLDLANAKGAAGAALRRLADSAR